MSASVYLFAQQCMHDGVKKQNKDASEITSGVANASLSLLAVAMTGGLAAVGRAALTVRGAATVENIAAASRVAASASRVFNLGVDGLNFSKEVVDVFDGCKDKLAAVELASKQNSHQI
jgi:hypothetical protein